jgi:hypothetical protein
MRSVRYACAWRPVWHTRLGWLPARWWRRGASSSGRQKHLLWLHSVLASGRSIEAGKLDRRTASRDLRIKHHQRGISPRGICAALAHWSTSSFALCTLPSVLHSAIGCTDNSFSMSESAVLVRSNQQHPKRSDKYRRRCGATRTAVTAVEHSLHIFRPPPNRTHQNSLEPAQQHDFPVG